MKWFWWVAYLLLWFADLCCGLQTLYNSISFSDFAGVSYDFMMLRFFLSFFSFHFLCPSYTIVIGHRPSAIGAVIGTHKHSTCIRVLCLSMCHAIHLSCVCHVNYLCVFPLQFQPWMPWLPWLLHRFCH